MKKYTKITAMVLSLLIFAYCIPFNVFATDTDSSYVSETESAGSMVEESIELVENDVIGDVVEVVEMRQENVKHFRLADGTYEAIIYPQAVHRKDENGVWQDIDNDLKLQSLEGTQKYATRDHRVRFSKNFEFNNQLFSLNENGYAISMTLVGTDNSLSSSSSSLRPGESPIPSNSPSVVNPEKDRSDTNSYGSLEEAVSIDNKSSIIYSGVKANTDIEYVLQGNDIKENIIVNATSDSYEYLFVMELVGLTAQLDTVGNVKITDSETGQSKYIIPAPYMYDNNGIYSYDVHYELAMMSNGRYALGVVADEEWINADGRAFPVTIDPTLTLDIAAFDSYTDPYPNNSCCYGYSEELWISDSQTTYIQIDMPELPTEATINDVQLHISYYYNDNITYGTLVVGAYQILENWEEHLINHDNAPSVSTTQLSTANLFASTGISASNPGPASFDITDAAVSWHAGTTGNYGIALKHESGSNESVVLKSYESGEDYPYISVNYSYYLPDGVYAIMSEATRHWITVESDSKYAGSNIQHEYAADSPADSSVFDRSSLFKISRKTANYYIIRSMLNNNLSFKVSDGKIVTTEIPSDDADVLPSQTFVIESNGESGLVIRPYGTSYYIHMPSTSADLTTVHKDNATVRSRWSFVQYTGNHKTGMWMTMPASWGNVGIVVGNSGNASAYGWSTRINANTMSLEIKSGYERMGSFTSQTSSCKKTFTATNPGEIAFSTIVKYANGTSVGSSTYTRNIVPQQGTYLIQNVGTEKYADIEGPSKAEGAIIQQWTFSAANQKKWVIEHVSGSGGYVRIKSVYSDLYIGVDSSSTTTVRQYSTKNDYTLWKVQLTSSDNLKLTNKATGTVLSSPSSSSNGANLTMVTYSNDSAYRDEWRMYENVSFNSFAMDIGESQTAEIITDCANNLIDPTDYTYTVTSGTDFVSVDNTTGLFTAHKVGTATVIATHKTTGISNILTISVSALQLFKTSRRPGLGEDGKTARDMKVSDLSKSELASININLIDLANQYDSPSSSSTVLPQQGPEVLIGYMKQLPGLFAMGNSNMRAVVTNMVDRFLSGTGVDFSDPTLTTAVHNHQSTITFVNSTKQVLCSALNSCDGDIYSLVSNPSFIGSMDNVSEPAYNDSSDYTNGLKIALNGIWGYDIDVIEFEFDGVNYSGTIRYTLFDHFGLDEGDITNSSITSGFLGYTAQFGSWFVLQRYENCESQYKPFVTYITFEETFSGEIS